MPNHREPAGFLLLRLVALSAPPLPGAGETGRAAVGRAAGFVLRKLVFFLKSRSRKTAHCVKIAKIFLQELCNGE